MAVKIRLQRHGKKNFAFFHPNTNPATIVLKTDRALAWLNVGAQPTLTARRILSYEGILLRKHLQGGVAKGALTQEQADQKFEAWKAQRDAKINAKIEGISKANAAASKAAVEAEAKVNEARAEAIAKKKAEAEEAARAAAEAAAAEKAAQEAAAAEAENAAAAAEETPAEA